MKHDQRSFLLPGGTMKHDPSSLLHSLRDMQQLLHDTAAVIHHAMRPRGRLSTPSSPHSRRTPTISRKAASTAQAKLPSRMSSASPSALMSSASARERSSTRTPPHGLRTHNENGTERDVHRFFSILPADRLSICS